MVVRPLSTTRLLLGLAISLGSTEVQAEDCIPNTVPLDSIGLFDREVWICPTVNQTSPVLEDADPYGTQKYWMRVLDPRACPVDAFWVIASGTAWDPVPRWPKGQTFFFLVDGERRAAIVSGKSDEILATGNSCRGGVDRIERLETAPLQGAFGLADDTVIFRPRMNGERAEEGKTLLYAEGASPRVRVSVPEAEAGRVIRWKEVLETRGTPAAVGVNFSRHSESCGDRTPPGPRCEFDSDCAICHDSSSCGTLTTRQSVFEQGAACRLDDAAECESAVERCCDGHCTLRPF